jgi:hypothetical protein
MLAIPKKRIVEEPGRAREEGNTLIPSRIIRGYSRLSLDNRNRWQRGSDDG